MKWVVLIAAIGTNVVASIMLKIAVLQIRKLEMTSPVTYALNLNVWLGIIAYGLSFVFYIVALGLFLLNFAHPVITSAALVSIAIASVLIFKESFRLGLRRGNRACNLWNRPTCIAFGRV